MNNSLLKSLAYMVGSPSPVVTTGRCVPFTADTAMAAAIRAVFRTPLRARYRATSGRSR